MIIDRREFKELKSEGGGLLKAISAVAKFEHGVTGIKKGTPLTLYVMKNGVFIDVSFNKKIYFEFKDIKNVDVSGYNLTLNIEENGPDCEIVLRISNVNGLKKVYMGIREYCKLKYIPEKDVLNKLGKNKIINDKEAEKERKRKEFERIMASNPEVSTSTNRAVAAKREKQVCCPKCGSTQLSANKKGFSLGKALVGGIALVPIAGVATGMIGKNKIIITCLSCGKQFKPGK